MTPDVFSLQFRRDGGVVVVGVSGELDMATAPVLRNALKEVIVDQGSLSVRVDLANTTFMDSTGLNALVGALKSMRDRDGQLTVSDPPPTIMRLLDLSGLSKVFDIVSSQDTRLGWAHS